MSTKAGTKVVNGPRKFFINQPHKPVDLDKDVRSHLVGIRKDVQYPQYVMDSLHREFSKPVDGNGQRKEWRPISDERYAKRYPKYRIYWLCRAEDKPDNYVRGLLTALFDAPWETKSEPETVIQDEEPEYELG